MRVKIHNAQSSAQALGLLAKLTAKSIVEDQNVRISAIALTNHLRARDDRGEVEAIYRAVKHGDGRVPGLRRGYRYIADPLLADYFVRPGNALSNCAGTEVAPGGACGDDCDGHAALVCALLGSIGFVVGLRVYTKPGDQDPSHVYAVVGLPKGEWPPREELGLDTTWPDGSVGWEPARGSVKTAWIK
jgi:hypothetical protein